MKSRVLFFILFSSILLSGCQYLQPKEEKPVRPVARVEDSYLMPDELVSIISNNADDSANLASKYVDIWIRKQLMINKATQEIGFDQAEIDRKVEDYRYSLIVHEFEKVYINSHLDTEVTPEEVESYYNEYSDNFLLKQNIVKCLFAMVPKSAPGINSFRRNLRAFPQSNKEDLLDYAYQYALKSVMDDSIWFNFDEVIASTPLKDIPNKTQFLRRTRYNETSDEDHIFFLRILEFKISDEISPLEFIREDVESIIINKRKIDLKRELERAVYDEARNDKLFEIYSN